MPIYLTNPNPRTKEVLKPTLEKDRMIFVDIGAGGGIKQEWHPLADVSTFIGFDGSKDRLEEIRRSGFSCDLYDEFIDQEEGEATFYVTTRWCSGLLRSVPSFMKRIASFVVHDPVREEKVRTIPFDKWVAGKYDRVDFLKIDVEGSENRVLRSAEKSFHDKKILGVLTEVWVDPRQKGQPSFAETDMYVRSHGFHLFDWMPQRAPRKALPAGVLNAQQIDQNNIQLTADSWPFVRWGQIMNSDALYFRDPIWDVEHDEDGKWAAFWDNNTLLRFILLLDLYGYPDVAIEALSYFRRRFGQSLTTALLSALVPDVLGKQLSYEDYYSYSIKIHNDKLLPDHQISSNPYDKPEPFDF